MQRVSKKCIVGFPTTELKIQSCKLYKNKYIITSTQITKIFAFIAGLIFKLLRRKILFINRKRIENVDYFTSK